MLYNIKVTDNNITVKGGMKRKNNKNAFMGCAIYKTEPLIVWNLITLERLSFRVR